MAALRRGRVSGRHAAVRALACVKTAEDALSGRRFDVCTWWLDD